MPGIIDQTVLDDAIKAAQQVLVGQWSSVAQAATTQITALVENARFIEDNASTMSKLEYQATKINQQRALEGVLQGFEAIGIVIAEQVAAAVWGVVETALKKSPAIGALLA